MKPALPAKPPGLQPRLVVPMQGISAACINPQYRFHRTLGGGHGRRSEDCLVIAMPDPQPRYEQRPTNAFIRGLAWATATVAVFVSIGLLLAARG